MVWESGQWHRDFVGAIDQELGKGERDMLTNELEALADEILVGVTGADTVADCRKAWQRFRRDNGFGTTATALLTAPSHQPKTNKNEIPTYALHLSPAGASGVDTCAFKTDGCEAACLNTAGRGRFDGVQRGRIAKTLFLAEHPALFLRILLAEIEAAVRRHDGRALFRLNATSDLRWERFAPFLFEVEGAEFYDYTKYPRRPNLPSNYMLCYSVSERNDDEDVLRKLAHFGHVSVVVDTPAPKSGGAKLPLPTTYLGEAASDGDETDDWRDRAGMVLLRVKGQGVGDTSGFVRPTHA